MVVGERGERGDIAHLGMRTVAGEGAREANERFGMKMFGSARGIGQIVDEPVIDLRHAGGVDVAKIADLDGGGSGAEGEEAIAGGVAGEIDEDVDLVDADLLRDLRVFQQRDVAPVVGVVGLVGVLLEALGHRITEEVGAVAENFELLRVVPGEEVFDEEGHGVLAEVGGDVADAQAARGGAVIRMRRHGDFCGIRVVRGPPDVFVEDRLRLRFGEVLEREEVAGEEGLVVRCAFEVMAERGEGVFGLAEVAQRDGDAGVCIEKIGIDHHGFAE